MTIRIDIDGGAAFAVAAEEDTLLRGALRAGIGLPHECSVGGCGACRFDLLEGEMETLWDAAPGLSERDRRRGKRLACQSRPLGDCRIRVRCSDEYRPAVPPRRRQVRLVDKRNLTRDMVELSFQGEEQAQFLPGQYALLYPHGVTGARAYSMANLANPDGFWRFIVRRVPGGRGSNALADLEPSDTPLWLDGPYGHAFLRPTAEREIVCVAGGSGLAPMLSVAYGALGLSAPPRIHFFDGARTAADLCAAPFLAAAPADRLTYIPVLSAPDADRAWTGETGFVHEAVRRTLQQPLNRYEFYFAGPPPMIEALQTLLMVENGVPFDQIHYDRFV